MVFEGCRRSSEGLWAEEDIGSRLEELHNQVTKLRQTWSAGVASNSVADFDLPFAGEVQMSRAGTERLLEYTMQNLPEQGRILTRQPL